MIRLGRPIWLLLGAISVFGILHLLFRADFYSRTQHPGSSSGSNTGYNGNYKSDFKLKERVRGSPQTALAAGGGGVPSNIVSEGVKIDSKGLTSWKSNDRAVQQHPIEALIERGKKLAQKQEARIREVTSLEDAVEEYERAYGMKPPFGFDAWYKYTRQFEPPSIPVAPLMPQAFEPFLPFLSIPPDILRERVETARESNSIYTFQFVPDGEGDEGTACDKGEDWFPEDAKVRGRGRVTVHGVEAWSWRCNNTLQLILPILSYFPEEIFHQNPPFEIPFGVHDGPTQNIHSNFKDRSEAFAKAGKVWPKASLHKAEQAMRWTWGWQWSCPEGTPLKTQHTDLVLNDLPDQIAPGDNANTVQKSFIADFDRSSDYCNYLETMNLHIITLSEKHRAAGELRPIVTICKSKHNSDIVSVALDGAWETPEKIPWEDKTIPKAFWRGSATGLHHNKGENWRQSQRERLHSLAQNTSSNQLPLLLKTSKGLETKQYSIKELNDKYVDAGLIGGPVQCNEADGSCAEMAEEINFLPRVRKEESLKYKFVIDVDGNGWSSRFRRLMLGNNVVLKSTLYPEWFSTQAIPWYHYVPLKLDYSDIYDIIAFFEGSPDGSGKGHDDLAKEIARNGQKFVEERWRVEDMGSFMYLLILEFYRMMSQDRQEASFSILA